MKVSSAPTAVAVLVIALLVSCDDPLRPTPGNQHPVATIASPSDGATFVVGQTITFVGIATDAEDGELDDAQLHWSTATGPIATGPTLPLDTLDVGTHVILFVATDAEQRADTASITVHVVMPPPASDSRAPIVDSMSITPDTIDVTTDLATVVARLRIHDDIAGVDSIAVVLAGPGGTSSTSTIAWEPTEGSRLDGTWLVPLSVPRYATAGVWTIVEVFLIDLNGNAITLTPTRLAARDLHADVVVRREPDTTAPTLTGVTIAFDSVAIDSLGAAIGIDVAALDSPAGVQFATLTLTSPSGSRALTGHSFTPAAGTVNAGTWHFEPVIPVFAESGSWTIETLELRDLAGNVSEWDAAELAAAGFDYTVEVASATPDTTAPALISFELLPDSVRGQGIVIARLQLSDDLAGVESGWVRLEAPGDAEEIEVWLYSPTTGTRTDGVWEAHVSIDETLTRGVWTASMSMIDAAGNTLSLSSDDLEAAGSDSRLYVMPPDHSFFTLTAFELEPDTVDVTGDSATVEVRLSGRSTVAVSYVSIVIAHEFGSPSSLDVTLLAPTSGTRFDGEWRHTFVVPRYAPEGQWTVQYLHVSDDFGYNSISYDSTTLRASGFDADIHVIDANPDTTAPVVTDVSIEPDTAVTSTGPVNVVTEIRVTDDLAGVRDVMIQIQSPSGYNGFGVTVQGPEGGTDLDGTWRAEFALHQFSEPGPWTLYIVATDTAGNRTTLGSFELEAAGMESELIVE